MKEMVFHYWCDNKDAQHPPRTVEGQQVQVWLPTKQRAVEIDLCEDCYDGMAHLTVQMLADKWGRDLTPPQVDIETLACPLGCKNGAPFQDRGGRSRHMTRVHPEWVVQHLEEFGPSVQRKYRKPGRSKVA